MSDEQKAQEAEVFDQKLSMDELDAAAGGKYSYVGQVLWGNGEPDADPNNCTEDHKRPMYGGGGFPNCAATVEDGSHCATNDACYSGAVSYQGLNDCAKAWR